MQYSAKQFWISILIASVSEPAILKVDKWILTVLSCTALPLPSSDSNFPSGSLLRKTKQEQTKEGKREQSHRHTKTTAVASAPSDCGASWADKEKEWPINYPCVPDFAVPSTLHFLYVMCVCVCIVRLLSYARRRRGRRISPIANNDTSSQCKKGN